MFAWSLQLLSSLVPTDNPNRNVRELIMMLMMMAISTLLCALSVLPREMLFSTSVDTPEEKKKESRHGKTSHGVSPFPFHLHLSLSLTASSTKKCAPQSPKNPAAMLQLFKEE